MMVSPIGVNNLNQLVEQQLGNTGYEVVRAIYNNILKSFTESYINSAKFIESL